MALYGKRFKGKRRAVSAFELAGLSQSRSKSRKKLSVKPHDKVRKSCVICGLPHTKAEHKFHGKGSFGRTH